MSENRYSQWGEENIVRTALSSIDSLRPGGVLVEFGGSKGRDNSNLFAFGEDGRPLVLIEQDPKLFQVMREAGEKFPNITSILASVGFEQSGTTDQKTLSKILESQNIDPAKVAIVSIDIDSDDAAVFENLGGVDPLLVLVEYNNSFPSDVRVRNPKGKAWGNSSLELCEVAKARGMFLAAATNTNLVFLGNDLASTFEQLDLQKGLEPFEHSRLGLAYDGTLVRFTTGGINTTRENYQGWGNTLVRQPIPLFMRGYPARFKLLRWIYFLLIGFVSNPIGFARYSGELLKYLRNRR
jgi:hypothetical protein